MKSNLKSYNINLILKMIKFLIVIVILITLYINLIKCDNDVVSKIENIYIDNFGDVEAMVLFPSLGKGENNKIIAIHGKSKSLNYEWLDTAEYLAKHGYHIIVLNLHSNQKTTPSKITAESFELFLKNFISIYFKNEKIFLMGKSWGATNVARFVHYNPDYLKGIVLAAPIISSEAVFESIGNNKMKTLLLYCQDDELFNQLINNSILDKWKAGVSKYLTIHSEDFGGHSIVESYAPIIQKFFIAVKSS
jgi:dienelactone hydrolase